MSKYSNFEKKRRKHLQNEDYIINDVITKYCEMDEKYTSLF